MKPKYNFFNLNLLKRKIGEGSPEKRNKLLRAVVVQRTFCIMGSPDDV